VQFFFNMISSENFSNNFIKYIKGHSHKSCVCILPVEPGLESNVEALIILSSAQSTRVRTTNTGTFVTARKQTVL
jgi:hypothetical protein